LGWSCDRLFAVPTAAFHGLRAQGLRPIQIWVPDVRAPSFRAEAHRQSSAVAAGPHAREDRVFIDAVSDWGDE
jgi:hypothetical protein